MFSDRRVRHHVFNKRSPSSATINQVLSQEIQHLEKVTSDLSNGEYTLYASKSIQIKTDW